MNRVRDLQAMDRDMLLGLWTNLFRKPAPKGLSLPFLRRFIAFEIQTRNHGGLSNQTKKALTASASAARPKTTRLEPGGRLIREWNSVTHTVEVTDHGYHWNGETYRSLSAIARTITGAHWSGPRFFGLNGRSGA